MRVRRALAASLAVAFALTGGAFLIAPEAVQRFFNALSGPLGLPSAPVVGPGLWLVLAGAYMYLVTFLAAAMARWPEERGLSLLLANAKLASSLLSLVFFVRLRYLCLAVNFVVDLALGLFVLWLGRRRTP